MSQQLPPLNALRAFEAVARHLSFTKAAAELNVTRAAISHQIKFLEDYLGFALVERKSRAVVLTPQAEAALPKLREGFNNLAEAVRLMRGVTPAQRIFVCAAPSFTAKWLVPRLPRFSRQHPEIDMQINSNAILVDADMQQGTGLLNSFFRQHQVDVVISFCSASHAGKNAEKLFQVSAVPMCHPALVSDSHPHPLRQPQDLAFHTLLHDDTDYVGHPTWMKWLQLHGIEGVSPNRGLHFNQVSLSLDAAIDGQGVLLGLRPLAQADIDAGRLCIPFDLPMPLEHAYYIIRPQAAGTGANQQACDAFVEWLREEAQL